MKLLAWQKRATSLSKQFSAALPKPKSLLQIEGDVATLFIYSYIGVSYWDDEDAVTAKQIAKQLDELPVDCELVVAINSPGGDTFEGEAIASLIRQCTKPKSKTARIDGLCASAATFIACACPNVEMYVDAVYMIHRTWMFTIGNADDHRESITLLEKMDGIAAGMFSRRTGKSVDECLDMMSAETWMTAGEAKDQSFVDKVFGQDGEEKEEGSPDSRIPARSLLDDDWPRRRAQARVIVAQYDRDALSQKGK
jgi:ATP-dependent protease ClpP protease subunit